MTKKVIICGFVFFLIGLFSLWKIGSWIDNKNQNKIITQPTQEASKAEVFANSKREMLKTFNNSFVFPIEEEEEDKIIVIDKKKSISEYAQEISQVLKIMEKERVNELEVFVKIIDYPEKNSKEDILALGKSQSIFEHIANSFQNINPPQDALDIHQNIATSAQKLSDNLYFMGRTIIHPQQALDSAWQYPKNLENFYSELINLNNYFQNKNFVFDEKDKINIKVSL